jgi:transcriptional regulator with XRE-family HTH domain
MANVAKKLDDRKHSKDAIDISRARLVRRGPGRPVSLSLRALRGSSGKTQAQVSKSSGISQPEVSKIEGASSLDDRMVGTVRRYLAALGDELELTAVSKYGHRIGIATSAANGEDAPQSPTKDELLRSLWSLAQAMERKARTGDVGAAHCALVLHALNNLAQLDGAAGLAAIAKAVRGLIGKMPSDPNAPLPLAIATDVKGDGQLEDVYALLKRYAEDSIDHGEPIEKNVGRLVVVGSQYVVSAWALDRDTLHQKIDDVLQHGRLSAKRQKDPAAIASAVMRVLTGRKRQWGGRARQAQIRKK